MKATLMDVGLILLIVVGSAGADGPAIVTESLQAVTKDITASKPKYTPIPASRKQPVEDALRNASNASPVPLAQQVDFESLPLPPVSSKTGMRSEFIPEKVAAKKPAKNVSYPDVQVVPGVEYSVAPAAAQPQLTPTPAPAIAGPPPSGGLILPAPPAAVQVPATVYTSPEPSYAYKPLVPVVATPPTIHLGRGILGQPTVYVPGQPVRNFFRYFSP